MIINNINYRVKIYIYLAILTFITIGITVPFLYVNVVNAMENEIIDASFNTITQLQNSTEMLIQGFDSLILPASLDFNLNILRNNHIT